MENWQDLYVELAAKITEGIKDIVWVDLWHNQVNHLEEEHRFNTPAVFIGLRSKGMEDLSEKVQLVNLQIDFYLFYETYLDTFQGAYNQQGALEFTESLDKLNGLFHGTTGINYTNMRRIDFSAVDTGSAGNLYKISFECLLKDESAIKYFEDVKIKADIENDDKFFIQID